MIMKQMPFAWLVSLFSSKKKPESTWVSPPVIITDKDGVVIFNSGADPKIIVNEPTPPLTAPEKWLDNLKKNFKPNDLIMMSPDTLYKMVDVDKDGWIKDNTEKISNQIVFIEAQKNVAILKS